MLLLRSKAWFLSFSMKYEQRNSNNFSIFPAKLFVTRNWTWASTFNSCLIYCQNLMTQIGKCVGIFTHKNLNYAAVPWDVNKPLFDIWQLLLMCFRPDAISCYHILGTCLFSEMPKQWHWSRSTCTLTSYSVYRCLFLYIKKLEKVEFIN